MLPQGSRVVIFGLVGKPELNGKHGVVQRFEPESGRYAVMVPSSKGDLVISLKPANIEQLPLLPLEKAETLLAEGNAMRRGGDFMGAIVKLGACCAAGEQVQNKQMALDLEAAARSGLGGAYDALGQLEEAEAQYLAALRSARESGNRLNEGTVLGNLATTSSNLGKHEEAVEHLTRAVKICHEEKDRVKEADFLVNLGAFNEEAGHLEAAIVAHQQALAICYEIGHERGAYAALRELGRVFMNVKPDRCTEAITHLQDAMAACRALSDLPSEANILHNLGLAYRGAGQHEKAVSHLTDSIVRARKLNDRKLERVLLHQLARCCMSLKQYGRAIEHHELATSLELGAPNVLDSLAGVASEQELVQYLEGDVSRNWYSLKLSAMELGEAYFEVGQYTRSMEFSQRASLESHERGDYHREIKSLGILGGSLVRMDPPQPEQAAIHFAEALRLYREDRQRLPFSYDFEGGLLINLAAGYFAVGRAEEAAALLREAMCASRAAGDNASLLLAMANLASILHLSQAPGQHEKVIELYKDALQLVGSHVSVATFSSDGSHQLEVMPTIHTNLGARYLESDAKEDQVLASQHLETAVATFDDIWDKLASDEQRVSYADTPGASSAYRLLQRSYAYTDRNLLALEVAERTHSRALEVLLARHRLGSKNHLPSQKSVMPPDPPVSIADIRACAHRGNVAIVFFSVVQSCEVLAWVVTSHDSSIQSFNLHLEQPLSQMVELTRRCIGASARSSGPSRSATCLATPLTPNDTVDSTLDEQSLQLELGAAASSDLASPEEIGRLLQLRNLEPLDAAMAADLSSLRLETTTKLLRRCHDALIAPLSKALEGEGRLLIIPDHELYALPFAALLDADGKYLIEKHSIRLAPSIGSIIEIGKRPMRTTDEGAMRALVVGGPDFTSWTTASGTHLSELKGAKEEASEVKRCLEQAFPEDDDDEPTIKVERLVGKKASKAAVKALLSTSEIVHLATHGDAGSIYFTGPNAEEATLTMCEVQQMRLSAHLVVMSACDSFGGQLGADGVVGISRAFLAAGAQTVVSSLWNVSDAATLELMKRFYQMLAPGGSISDPAEAMQAAVVSMIKEGVYEVLHWAAFVVYGLGDLLPPPVTIEVHSAVASAETSAKPYDATDGARWWAGCGESSSDSTRAAHHPHPYARSSTNNLLKCAVSGPSEVARHCTSFALKVWMLLKSAVADLKEELKLFKQDQKDSNLFKAAGKP